MNIKTQRAKALREMSSEQLELTLKETKQNLFDLRFQSATEKLDSPSNIKKLRRQIARINTLLTERQRSTVTA